MNRGNRREDIFMTDSDRTNFLDGLADSCVTDSLKHHHPCVNAKSLSSVGTDITWQVNEICGIFFASIIFFIFLSTRCL